MLTDESLNGFRESIIFFTWRLGLIENPLPLRKVCSPIPIVETFNVNEKFYALFQMIGDARFQVFNLAATVFVLVEVQKWLERAAVSLVGASPKRPWFVVYKVEAVHVLAKESSIHVVYSQQEVLALLARSEGKRVEVISRVCPVQDLPGEWSNTAEVLQLPFDHAYKVGRFSSAADTMFVPERFLKV